MSAETSFLFVSFHPWPSAWLFPPSPFNNKAGSRGLGLTLRADLLLRSVGSSGTNKSLDFQGSVRNNVETQTLAGRRGFSLFTVSSEQKAASLALTPDGGVGAASGQVS